MPASRVETFGRNMGIVPTSRRTAIKLIDFNCAEPAVPGSNIKTMESKNMFFDSTLLNLMAVTSRRRQKDSLGQAKPIKS